MIQLNQVHCSLAPLFFRGLDRGTARARESGDRPGATSVGVAADARDSAGQTDTRVLPARELLRKHRLPLTNRTSLLVKGLLNAADANLALSIMNGIAKRPMWDPARRLVQATVS
jgi:hypothetical protein